MNVTLVVKMDVVRAAKMISRLEALRDDVQKTHLGLGPEDSLVVLNGYIKFATEILGETYEDDGKTS